MYKLYFKRPLDIILSLFAILVFSPIMIIVAVMVRIKLGAPIIYSVKRPGKNEKIFILYKFRTMNEKYNPDGQLLPDNMRLTRFGQLLRHTSLDELPELFNILKGDMSIVGPRPLAVQYLPYYFEKERRRHSIKPGLTGLAQIKGRNGLDWESKFAYDIEYIDRMNFIFDIQIICNTIFKVISRENIGIQGIDAPEDFDKYRTRQNELKKSNIQYEQ